MAKVFLAHDLKYDRAVAVKVLRPDLAADVGAARFLHEIQIAARLHHPHILPLYDSDQADGLVYYVMPYIQGETLRARLERERQLPVSDALQIAREVADALNYAHGNNVVHRDIKPANILIDAGHAVVSDFGIARAVGEGESTHRARHRHSGLHESRADRRQQVPRRPDRHLQPGLRPVRDADGASRRSRAIDAHGRHRESPDARRFPPRAPSAI